MLRHVFCCNKVAIQNQPYLDFWGQRRRGNTRAQIDSQFQFLYLCISSKIDSALWFFFVFQRPHCIPCDSQFLMDFGGVAQGSRVKIPKGFDIFYISNISMTPLYSRGTQKNEPLCIVAGWRRKQGKKIKKNGSLICYKNVWYFRGPSSWRRLNKKSNIRGFLQGGKGDVGEKSNR